MVGAITYWPLSIGFPFAMYVTVYNPPQRTQILMKTVAAVMLLVAIAATIASVRCGRTSVFVFGKARQAAKRVSPPMRVC